MHRVSNVFLVGPMGAGKSTIGRRLARNLGLTFVDADQEIERRTGASIAIIFDIEGESGFRTREKELLRELVTRRDIVLATGGGAVLDPANRALLRENGFVVYLHAPLEKLLQRTRMDENRPLLTGNDRELTMRTILETREPMYRDTADLIVDTGGRTLGDIVSSIKGAIP